MLKYISIVVIAFIFACTPRVTIVAPKPNQPTTQEIVAAFIKADYTKNKKKRYPAMSDKTAQILAKGVIKWTSEYGIDLDWKIGANSAESHWWIYAKDPRGECWGVPQMSIDTAQLEADSLHLHTTITADILQKNPDLTERLSDKYLSELLHTFKGDYGKAVRAYNAGDNAVKRNLKFWNFNHTKKELAGLHHVKKAIQFKGEWLKFKKDYTCKKAKYWGYRRT